MTLKTQMISDQAIFFNPDEFAETISYTPRGGVAADISAIVDRDGPFQEPYVRGEGIAICVIQVKKTEVTDPQYGGTFTFDSYTWEFDPEKGVTYEDDNILTIALEREIG